MRLLKPLRITSFIITVLVCAYYMNVLYAYLYKEAHLYKRQLASQYIEEDLAIKELTIDIKTKQVKTPAKMTPDDFKKALWVLKVQNEQLQYSLDSVRSALAYNEGE